MIVVEGEGESHRAAVETLGLDAVFVCEPDLEGSCARERTNRTAPGALLRRRSGNKPTYAESLAAALPLERIPPPIAQLLSAF